MKFKIVLRDWFRGHGGEDSRLVRVQDGQKCCLGFRLLAEGITLHELRNLGTPSDVDRLNPIPDWLLTEGADSGACCQLIQLNDDTPETMLRDGVINDMKDAERVRQKLIAEKFAENGDEVEYVEE